MTLVFWAIFVAVLSYEIRYSSLAYSVKRLFCLHKYYPRIEEYSTGIPFKSIKLKYLVLLGLPFGLIIVMAKLHKYVYELLQCQYCTAIQVGMITGLVLGYPLPTCLLLAFIGSFITSIYTRLRG